jgi:hypothetical protein
MRASSARTARSLAPASKCGLQQGPERTVPVDARRLRHAVVDEPRFAFFHDEARVLEQSEVARHARLRDAEDAGQFGDVEALLRQRTQQTQPRRVRKKPEERGGVLHVSLNIHISIWMHQSREDADRQSLAPTHEKRRDHGKMAAWIAERTAIRALCAQSV